MDIYDKIQEELEEELSITDLENKDLEQLTILASKLGLEIDSTADSVGYIRALIRRATASLSNPETIDLGKINIKATKNDS